MPHATTLRLVATCCAAGISLSAPIARHAGAATQYNLIMLNSSPFGGGEAFGIDNGQAVGDVQLFGGVVWNDPNHYTVLSPTSAGSVVNGISGNQQVGWIPISNQEHAALWAGTAASVVNLSPTPTTVCYATATDGTQQVGVIAGPTAALWAGTAASFVSLNPSGFFESSATGVANSVQVGYGRNVGGLMALAWHGSANNVTVLRTGAEAMGIAPNGQVVGLVGANNTNEAALWTDGTPNSFVDVAPPNTNASELLATNGIHQVGDISVGAFAGGLPTDHHAGVWTGTAASFQMLPVPAGDSFSMATGIDAQGNISGYAGIDVNGGIGGLVPVIWQPVPEPSAAAAAALSAAVLSLRRTRRSDC